MSSAGKEASCWGNVEVYVRQLSSSQKSGGHWLGYGTGTVVLTGHTAGLHSLASSITWLLHNITAPSHACSCLKTRITVQPTSGPLATTDRKVAVFSLCRCRSCIDFWSALVVLVQPMFTQRLFFVFIYFLFFILCFFFFAFHRMWQDVTNGSTVAYSFENHLATLAVWLEKSAAERALMTFMIVNVRIRIYWATCCIRIITNLRFRPKIEIFIRTLERPLRGLSGVLW